MCAKIRFSNTFFIRQQLVVTPPDVTKFFLRVFRENYEHREKNNLKRNDFMQLLIQLNTKGYLDDVDAAKSEGIEEDIENSKHFAFLRTI